MAVFSNDDLAEKSIIAISKHSTCRF